MTICDMAKLVPLDLFSDLKTRSICNIHKKIVKIQTELWPATKRSGTPALYTRGDS